MMKFFILQKLTQSTNQPKRKGLLIMDLTIQKDTIELLRVIRLDIGLKLESWLEKELLVKWLNAEITKRKRMSLSKWSKIKRSITTRLPWRQSYCFYWRRMILKARNESWNWWIILSGGIIYALFLNCIQSICMSSSRCMTTKASTMDWLGDLLSNFYQV